MQHTTKMVMVPQDAYSSLISQQKQMYSPVVNQLSNLDQELQSIISNPNLPTDAKYHQYMNVFGRYQTLKGQQAKQDNIQTRPEPTPVIHGDLQVVPRQIPIDEQRLIDSLPKTVQRKGKLLLDHVKADPEHFQWLKSGELVSEGTPVHGSNITDLFHYATRNRKTAVPPIGFGEFEELLDESNVPKEALSPLDTTVSPKLDRTSQATPKVQKATTSRQPRAQRPTGIRRSISARYAADRPKRETRAVDRLGSSQLGNWVQY